MKIEIDEKKILTEVIEQDGSLHQKIKEVIEKRLIDQIAGKIEQKYLRNSWQGVLDEIDNRVLEDLEKQQTEIVKKILQEFYDSYRYKKSDLKILKKLKEFLGEPF